MASDRNSIGSVSLVRQGKHRFYSLTLPSDILAKCCFVISRDEDPIEGFQRELDEKRATEIAQYIDLGLGTIPSSIVLSAQPTANLEYDSKRKTVSFNIDKKSFLIIDGQHRVFGFIKAKTSLRVPVVIYSGLSKRDETRLFIDINSKQKGVPPELLLDIKRLAEYETNDEQFLRDVFDSFNSEPDSVLLGKLSPAAKSTGKISRNVFNRALKPLLNILGSKDAFDAYQIMNAYYLAFTSAVLEPLSLQKKLTSPTLFQAVSAFMPKVASRLKDRFGSIYNADNFYAVLESMEGKVKKSSIEGAGQAYKPLVKHFEDALTSDFQL
jgi:DGQHR domain-containing protein